MGEPNSASASLETATLLGRLRGTRGLWLFVLLTVIAPVSIWLQWQVIRAETNAPDIGFDVQRSATLGAFVAMHDTRRWPTLQSGDTIETFNGQPVTALNFWRHRVEAPAGLVRISFKREGQIFEASAATLPPNIGLGVAYSVRFMTGVCLLLLAFGAFLLRPGGAENWLFLIFVFGVGHLVMMTAGFLQNGLALHLIIYALLALTPGAGLLLLTVFPRRLDLSWGTRIGIVAVSLLLAFSHPLRVVVLGLDSPALPLEMATRSWAAGAAFFLALAQAVLARRARIRGDLRLAALYRSLAIASAIGIFAPLLISSAIRFLKLDGSYAMEASSLLVLVFAVLTAVVLVRHNPLAIDRYAVSVVGYVLTVGSLGLVFGLSLLALPLVLNRFGVAQSSEALIVLTASISISGWPIQERLRARIDLFFSQERANSVETAALMRSVVAAVQESSESQALTIILDAAKALGGERVSFWQLDSSRMQLGIAAQSGELSPATSLVLKGPASVLMESAGGVAELSADPLVPQAQQLLWSVGLALSAPVRANGLAVGFLALGRRPSGFSFRREDQVFLEALASQLGLALERSGVVADIDRYRSELENKEAELKSLTSELRRQVAEKSRALVVSLGSTTPAAALPAVNDVFNGRYRVIRALGRGGMGAVFEVVRIADEKAFALKLMLGKVDADGATRFLREAELAARINHPNLVSVVDVGSSNLGSLFLVMELVPGRTLEQLSEKWSERSWSLSVLCQVARAVEALHAERVVHRDLKPANVLVCEVDRRPQVKVSDFGIARQLDPIDPLGDTANPDETAFTRTGATVGTPKYLPPEIVGNARAVTAQADSFSFGVMACEVLCGTYPFLLPPALEVMGGRPPSDANTAFLGSAGLPGRLVEVLVRSLSVRAASRPSAEEFRVALDEALASVS